MLHNIVVSFILKKKWAQEVALGWCKQLATLFPDPAPFQSPVTEIVKSDKIGLEEIVGVD